MINSELLEAIRLLERERGVDAEVVFTAIEDALVSAYRRESNAKAPAKAREKADNIRGYIDRETGEMMVIMTKFVVEEVEDPSTEISLAEASAMSDGVEVGDGLQVAYFPKDFGRLAAQAAKSVISQKLNEAESERIHSEYSTKIGELVYGVVQRRDRREVVVDLDRAEAVLTRAEQSRLDNYEFNNKMRFYILRVDERRSRPVIYVSRSHPNLVRRLFEQEVPEIKQGVIDIESVAREAGSRTKIAVRSNDPNVDSVGSCVGQRGMRVQNVIDELHGEKIDIIEWDSDPVIYLSNALSPARVSRVDLFENEMAARVVVPDHQLSLAIGREGQNARLAARLTGWKIDIKSETQFREMLERAFMPNFDQAVLDDEARVAALESVEGVGGAEGEEEPEA